jgi:hypothetical protein
MRRSSGSVGAVRCSRKRVVAIWYRSLSGMSNILKPNQPVRGPVSSGMTPIRSTDSTDRSCPASRLPKYARERRPSGRPSRSRRHGCRRSAISGIVDNLACQAVYRPSRDFGSRNASIPKSPYSRPSLPQMKPASLFHGVMRPATPKGSITTSAVPTRRVKQ